MSVRNLDLKIVTKNLKKSTVTRIGGQVAPGQIRWVTFIRATGQVGTKSIGSGTGILFASMATGTPGMGSVIATTYRKFKAVPRPAEKAAAGARELRGVPMYPKQPNPNGPLFSIAGGAYLVAVASRTSAQVAVGYFDE
jgi:hypothetical protein